MICVYMYNDKPFIYIYIHVYNLNMQTNSLSWSTICRNKSCYQQRSHRHTHTQTSDHLFLFHYFCECAQLYFICTILVFVVTIYGSWSLSLTSHRRIVVVVETCPLRAKIISFPHTHTHRSMTSKNAKFCIIQSNKITVCEEITNIKYREISYICINLYTFMFGSVYLSVFF